MNCPKCGFEEAAGVECSRCGVVFARFEEMEARLRTVRVGSAAPEEGRSLLVRWVFAALVVAGVAAWVGRDAPETVGEAEVAASARPRRDAATLAARVAAASEGGGSCPLLGAGGEGSRPAVGGDWLETAEYEEAERQQRELGAPLLVYFRTDWCGYCRRLEAGLLADSAVESYLSEAVVRCRVNPEESAEARAVSDRYGVTGYPSLFLVADGLEPIRVSTYGRGNGFPPLSPAEFIAGLEGDARRLAQGLVVAGDRARRQGDLPQSLELLDRAVALDPGGSRALFYRGVARAAAGDSSGAYDDFGRAAELEPGNLGLFRETEQLLTQEGRLTDAAACWSLFLVDQPGNEEARQRRDRLRGRASSG